AVRGREAEGPMTDEGDFHEKGGEPSRRIPRCSPRAARCACGNCYRCAERRRARVARRRAGGPDDLGRAHDAGADLVRPGGEHPGHAVHDPPGDARCPGEADAWKEHGTQPRRVVDRVTRRARLRVRAAQGVKFHTGEPATAWDGKFPFERYRGMFAKTLKERVAAVE